MDEKEVTQLNTVIRPRYRIRRLVGEFNVEGAAGVDTPQWNVKFKVETKCVVIGVLFSWYHPPNDPPIMQAMGAAFLYQLNDGVLTYGWNESMSSQIFGGNFLTAIAPRLDVDLGLLDWLAPGLWRIANFPFNQTGTNLYYPMIMVLECIE